MFIDTHPHIISDDKQRFPAAPLGGKSSTWSEKASMPFERMVKEMDASGVSRSVLVQAATYYGYDNSYVASAIKAYPTRLGGVCTIDALADDSPQVLESWIDKGFCGVRLFVSGTSLQTDASWFSDPTAFPFWAKASDLGIPVCLQIGASAIPHVRKILVRFPDVKIVLDHLARPDIEGGAPYPKATDFFGLADFANLFLKFTPVNVNTIRKTESDSTAFVSKVVASFGAARITWGSNFPSTTDTLHKALAMCQDAMVDVSDADKEFIFGKTAILIYPWLGR